jgi:hypothetical protein
MSLLSLLYIIIVYLQKKKYTVLKYHPRALIGNLGLGERIYRFWGIGKY